MIQAVMPKKQLLIEVKRFLKDPDRGISIRLFAELCGVTKRHLLDVFYFRSEPLTEYMQIRVSKGYKAWQNGEVAIMQNQDKTKFVTFRKVARQRLTQSTGLQVVNGEIKIKVGISNQGDYSQQTLGEALNRG